MTDRFCRRDYPQKVVSRAYQRASNTNRQNLLQPRLKHTNSELRFVTSFNNQWHDIRQILSNNWNILTSDPKINTFVPQVPFLTARRAQNLSDHLTRSHFTKPKSRIGHGYTFRGSFPCGECSICGLMKPCKIFTHPSNGRTFPLYNYINCKTKQVVYALTCGCPKIYIGQTTQQLRQRVQKHLSTISLADRDFRQGKKLTTVAEHFLKEHGGKSTSLRVFGLERVHSHIRGGDVSQILLRKESKWIFDMDSLLPSGLNGELLFTGFL